MFALAAVLAVMAALCLFKFTRSASANAGGEDARAHAEHTPAPEDEAPEATEAAEAASPTFVPTPTPAPDLAEAVKETFLQELSFNTDITFDRSRPFADEILDHREELLALEQKLLDSAKTALERASYSAAAKCGVEPKPAELEGDGPSWQLMASLCWVCGAGQTEVLLKRSCGVSVDDGGDMLTASVSFKSFDDMIAELQPVDRFTADFVYSYYRTVYNDDFTLAEQAPPEVPDELAERIGFPLKYMNFRDSWYDPRQQSSRYHLGMDIHAAPDTNIYSCTDGVVWATGFDETAGYYVVIKDEQGFEFHYYHMIRLTRLVSPGDAVQRGQLIGNVGCTGNSDAYHLHLSIVTPDHVHINPYYVMLAVRDRGDSPAP